MVKLITPRVGPYGVTRISELEIDESKDFNAKDISNLGQSTGDTGAAQLMDAMLWGLL